MARQLVGTVISDKMDKTVAVEVVRSKAHRLYHKHYQVTKKFLAHNPDDLAKLGDRVAIDETRPLSRRKRWVVAKVLESANPAAAAEELS